MATSFNIGQRVRINLDLKKPEHWEGVTTDTWQYAGECGRIATEPLSIGGICFWEIVLDSRATTLASADQFKPIKE